MSASAVQGGHNNVIILHFFKKYLIGVLYDNQCNHFVNITYLHCIPQATGYAIQHIPVPVPSQDKLTELQQERHPA